jgi:hypothetical protein
MINPIILLILNFKFFRKQIRSGNISIALHWYQLTLLLITLLKMFLLL